jgi:hypothetical protein
VHLAARTWQIISLQFSRLPVTALAATRLLLACGTVCAGVEAPVPGPEAVLASGAARRGAAAPGLLAAEPGMLAACHSASAEERACGLRCAAAASPPYAAALAGALAVPGASSPPPPALA